MCNVSAYYFDGPSSPTPRLTYTTTTHSTHFTHSTNRRTCKGKLWTDSCRLWRTAGDWIGENYLVSRQNQTLFFFWKADKVSTFETENKKFVLYWRRRPVFDIGEGLSACVMHKESEEDPSQSPHPNCQFEVWKHWEQTIDTATINTQLQANMMLCAVSNLIERGRSRGWFEGFICYGMVMCHCLLHLSMTTNISYHKLISSNSSSPVFCKHDSRIYFWTDCNSFIHNYYTKVIKTT